MPGCGRIGTLEILEYGLLSLLSLDRLTLVAAVPGRSNTRRMASEIAVPTLPCADLDESVDFYEALGDERTYIVAVPDLDGLYGEFVDGLRAAHL